MEPANRSKRRVRHVTELTEENMVAIELAEVPAEYAYLDKELEDE
jgi:hypothetical protein